MTAADLRIPPAVAEWLLIQYAAEHPIVQASK